MSWVDGLVWVGTLTFAASGALVAVHRRFDIIGVLVLATVTAIGGGSIRDVMVGALPPAALSNEALLWGVAATAIVVFFVHRRVREDSRLLYALDTFGLALFAALGAERGMAYGMGPWGTVFAGAVSGVGGGVLRDVLVGQVPGIFYRFGDFYASAAALGALAYYLVFAVDPRLALVVAVIVTLVVRVGSRALKLRLPVPRSGGGEPPPGSPRR
ncbi:MAG: TRIC cation channel family protein [Trueperaceae bacterium]|nr:TRIC cation channel family protein [Trueperaceae bacterium]